MVVGSLFAGIGGFDLGFQRAGFDIAWQVEIDPYCQSVLAQHWPDVKRYGDIRYCGQWNLAPVDVLCGGFPCQPVSQAGEQLAQADERWLWPEYARLIRELRPRYVVMENVSNLLAANDGTAFSEVLGDLAACGYDAEWDCLPAASFGAPHLRNRVWILAYPGCESRGIQGNGHDGHHVVLPEGTRGEPAKWGEDRQLVALVPGVDQRTPADWWGTQSRMARSADGLPNQMDRNKALGNSIVPQIAEWLARRILDVEAVLDSSPLRSW